MDNRTENWCKVKKQKQHLFKFPASSKFNFIYLLVTNTF